MQWLRVCTARLFGLFRRRPGERDLETEIRSHLEMLTEENMRRGMSPEEARCAARREFGGLEQTKELYRERRGIPLLEAFLQDIRFAARILRRNLGFTAITVLTLALGIGANTAVFSVTEAFLLRPAPYPQADRLVMVWEDVHLPHYQNDQNTPAPGNFVDWRNRNHVFSGMAAVDYRSWNLTGTGEPVRVEGDFFSADIFSVLQTYPLLGRPFTPEEDRPGAPHVALLGYSLWASRFASDPGVIGRTIHLDEESYTVIGVTPKSLDFPDPGDQLFVPLALTQQQAANHGSHYLHVIARLKPAVTVSQAQSEMEVIAHQISAEHPDSNTGVGVRLTSLREERAGNMRRPLLMLSGVAALLLLMVCANVANLLLSRSSVRGRELAIRSALGASRARVLRQLLAESLLLALLGGMLGLGFAFWGIDALRAYAPAEPNFTGVRLNAVVDATLPVSRIRTMESIRSNYLGPQQFNLVLVGLFGVLALILAAVGLYGVASYSVAQRRREIGIRVALGAQPREILRLVVGQGTRLALLGLAIGTIAALALTRLVAALLYGIAAHDPLTFVAVAALLLLVAVAASYIPARRAMRVDPVVALRYE